MEWHGLFYAISVFKRVHGKKTLSFACVCVCVCARVCVFAYVRAHVYARARVRVHVCVPVCLCVSANLVVTRVNFVENKSSEYYK